MNLQFRDLLRAFVPPWLSDRGGPAGSFGFRLLFAFAILADLAAEFLTQGLQARFPGLGTPTALPYIGRDRVIRRGFLESDAAFAARLVLFRDVWRRTGNAFLLLEQLAAGLTGFAVPMRTVDTKGSWFSLDGAGTETFVIGAGNWGWDGNATLWARFWPILFPPTDLWIAGPNIGDPTLWGGGVGGGTDDGPTIGTTATLGQVKSVRLICGDRKPARSLCPNIIIALDPSQTDFDPTVGQTHTNLAEDWDPATHTLTRNQTARYWFGVA